MDGIAGGGVTVDGVGRYLTRTVALHSVAGASATFRAKGGGQMIALFAAQPSIWFKVSDVQASLCLQGVLVSRESVRDGLDQLVNMGFLERMQKMVGLKKVSGAAQRYRRQLSEAQRELLSAPAKLSAPRALAIRERRARNHPPRQPLHGYDDQQGHGIFCCLLICV